MKRIVCLRFVWYGISVSKSFGSVLILHNSHSSSKNFVSTKRKRINKYRSATIETIHNFLLTERKGRNGEYWPIVVAVRTERSEVRTKRPGANILQ